MSYYRGDDFGGEGVPVDMVPDTGNTGTTVMPYANTPDSAIRAAELKAGADVAASGFTGGGGFLKQQLDNLKVMAAFYAPFIPFIGPAALSSLPGAGTVASLAAAGGALRPTIAGITTALGATTTGLAATGSPPSKTPSTQSRRRRSTLSTQAEAGAQEALWQQQLALSAQLPASLPPISPVSPPSRRASPKQPKVSLAAVRRALSSQLSPKPRKSTASKARMARGD